MINAAWPATALAREHVCMVGDSICNSNVAHELRACATTKPAYLIFIASYLSIFKAAFLSKDALPLKIHFDGASQTPTLAMNAGKICLYEKRETRYTLKSEPEATLLTAGPSRSVLSSVYRISPCLSPLLILCAKLAKNKIASVLLKVYVICL